MEMGGRCGPHIHHPGMAVGGPGPPTATPGWCVRVRQRMDGLGELGWMGWAWIGGPWGNHGEDGGGWRLGSSSYVDPLGRPVLTTMIPGFPR